MESPIVRICDGMEHMDFARITEMLGGANWSLGISRAEVEQGASHSALVVGAFDGERQIGYARAISDKTRFAYLSDVFVDEAYRHNGIGQMMVHHILSHPSLSDVYQWALFTSNAQYVYEQVGFKTIAQPECWMQIRNSRPER